MHWLARQRHLLLLAGRRRRIRSGTRTHHALQVRRSAQCHRDPEVSRDSGGTGVPASATRLLEEGGRLRPTRRRSSESEVPKGQGDQGETKRGKRG